VEIASLGIDFAGLGIAPVTGVARAGLWLALAWMLLGAAYLVSLRARNPGRVNSLGAVFGQDDAGTEKLEPAGVAR
jgi:hypothetical protein